MKKPIRSAVFLVLLSVMFACTKRDNPAGSTTVTATNDTTQEVYGGKLWTGYYYDTTLYLHVPVHYQTITDTNLHFIKINDTTIKLHVNYNYQNQPKDYYLTYKSTDSAAQVIRYYGDYGYHIEGEFNLRIAYNADSFSFDFNRSYGSEAMTNIHTHLSTHH